MYRNVLSSWVKHLDFTILDCVCIELAFVIAYFIRYGGGNEYQLTLYKSAALILVLLHLIVVFFGEGYKGIIRRGNLEETKEIIKHVTVVVVLLSVYLYLTHRGEDFSRIIYVLTWAISIVLCSVVRISWKKFIRFRAVWRSQKKSLVIVTKAERALETAKTIKKNNFGDYVVSGLVLIDDEAVDRQSFDGVRVIANGYTMIQYMCHNWVDEVFFDISQGEYDCTILIDNCEKMGITVHQKLAKESDLFRHNQVVERMAGYTVLTSSVNIVTNREIFFKRLLDIVGGMVGVILTGGVSIFIMPAIYIKSPGPVFFSQWRVGKGGKKFKIYKFRSMYLDAEERKKELTKRNNIKDGFMFKMDNDPRIIKGIGKFIRDTSLDEFPQFFNVLKGDMSLVGTRPPTIDEWEKYELYHRKRLAIKPGLTGMWQISGRSKITDFDEVVELDTKYIKEWSLGLDLKILFKTVGVVFKREGAL